MNSPDRKFTLLLAALLILLAGGLAAAHFLMGDKSGRGQSLARWHGQVEDRARLLAEPFGQAVRRLEQARDDALARAQGQSREDSIVRYDQQLAARPDGTTRPKGEKFDPQGSAGVFLPPGLAPDDGLKHRIVTMGDTLNLFGQSWLRDYPNLWFAGVEKWLVAYYPEYPWTEKLEAGYDPAVEPWFTAALPESNPKQAAVWGAARADFVGRSLVASLSLPVGIDDKTIGVIAEDVPLQRLSDAVAVGEHETGVVRLVVDAGGGIVALSGRTAEILKAGAPLKADKGMADIASALEGIKSHGEASGAILDGDRKRAIVYARLPGQPWSLVTIVPNALLGGASAGSTGVFAAIAAVGALIVLGVAAFMLKRFIAEPMGRLAKAEAQVKDLTIREKTARDASEELARQVEEGRKKAADLEGRLAKANAAVDAAKAETADLAARLAAMEEAAASAAAVEAEAAVAPEPEAQAASADASQQAVEDAFAALELENPEA